ncbi:MAG: aminotransferase class V-fold PLP-dependent enzyme [Alphaproteobacteria bacterium]|nr:aminotransferase class V-fold PLP-dependent enzyme [Alphaproteobacteria bacterium]
MDQQVSRRTVLAGAGALALATRSNAAVSAEDAAYFAAEEPFFLEFAKEFTLDPKVTYFMAAQKGSMPKPVLARMKEGLDHVARDPFPVYVEPSAKIRERIAAAYGTTPDQIAITRNTTDALTLAMMGIEWKPGDEILITPLEHPTGITIALRIAARYGVVVRQWGVPSLPRSSADEVVAAIERRVVPGKTKVVFFSSPLWPTGMRMPERRIAEIAQKAGAITVVDGAHYNGMFDPRLDESGIDFFALCGHKWQNGPGGTGLLYVRNRELPSNPTPLPRFHLVRTQSREVPFDGSRGYDVGAALSLYGFPESADWRALGDAVSLWDKIGRKRIETWHLRLGAYFRDRIVETFGEAAVLRPQHDPALQSGIIGFNPFPKPEQRRDEKLNVDFRSRILREYGFRISGLGVGSNGLTRKPDPEAAAFPSGTIPNRDPATLAPAPMDHPQRVNACVWNSRADVDRFIDATKDLVAKMT